MPVLGLCVAVTFTAGTLAAVLGSPQVISVDSALFQHTGWYITQGGVPYVDVWDINPPVIFGITAALAVVAGGDMFALHVLSAGLTVAVAAASVLVVGWLAYRLTGEDAPALAAGLVMLALPELYGLPAFGVRSQYFTLFFGVVALAAVLDDRPFLAGASAAASAGAWQPGGALALLVVAMAGDRGGRRGALAAVAGGATVAALVVTPFVAAGAFVPMVVQTVVAPIVGHAPYTVVGRVLAVMSGLGYATAVLPVALAGWYGGLAARRDYWWVPAGGLVYGLQLVFLNNNGSLDALLLLVFVALGVALAVAALRSRRHRRLVLVALGLLVLVAPVWSVAAAPPLKEPVVTQREQARPSIAPPNVGAQSSVPPIRTIYWEQHTPRRCHYRLSWTELRWIARTDASLDATECGAWYPSAGSLLADR